MANVSVQAKTQKGSESQITFHKQKTLAYGVQLFELAAGENGKRSLGNSGYFEVRGLKGSAKKRKAFRPPAYARIGEADGDISVCILGDLEFGRRAAADHSGVPALRGATICRTWRTSAQLAQ
jgi:hypothetical protein